MDLAMMECLKWERRMGMVHIFGQIRANILVIGQIIISKDKVSILGLMEGDTQVNGKTISFMEEDNTTGQTGENTMENIN